MWTFVKQCMQSDQVYTVRFGVVMGLDHFGEESYLWEAFRYFDEITLEDYYVKWQWHGQYRFIMCSIRN